MKSKKAILILTILCTLLIPVTAFAYSYSGIVLPSLSRNAVLADRYKTTNDAYFSHRVTSMGGTYKYVNVWLYCSALSRNLTPAATHRVGDPYYNVYYYDTSLGSTVHSLGVPVNLTIENASYTGVAVEASGSYDVR
ncbi:hypothetical protein [Clostridium kluyveri]|uniref:Uncharacterized protein n=1 Tax=Clostridium kluyveri TaxID=1534 RepID=A0A1L5FCR6_CLOKL|nr:hypothetical protein [Clostridium kluyveri]APM40796.1 hypothetical protein BS101_19825 [Clostridium kluyveri]